MISTWFQAGIVTSAAGDSLWDKVTFLLAYDGAKFINAKDQAVVTLTGAAAPSTSQTAVGLSRSISYPGVTAQFAQIADNPAIAFGTSDFTIEFVCNIASVDGNSGTAIMPMLYWGQTATPGNNCNFEVAYLPTTRQITIGAVGFASNNYYSITMPTTISTGVLHHITLVRKSGTLTAYVDGVQQGSSIAMSVNVTHAVTTPLYIGRRLGGDGSSWYHRGFISSIRITNAARYSGASYTLPATFPISA